MMGIAENPPCDDRVMVLDSDDNDPHVLPLSTCICVVPLGVPIIPTRLAVLVPILLTKQAAITSPVCTTNCGEVGNEVFVQGLEAVAICDAL